MHPQVSAFPVPVGTSQQAEAAASARAALAGSTAANAPAPAGPTEQLRGRGAWPWKCGVTQAQEEEAEKLRQDLEAHMDKALGEAFMCAACSALYLGTTAQLSNKTKWYPNVKKGQTWDGNISMLPAVKECPNNARYIRTKTQKYRKHENVHQVAVCAHCMPNNQRNPFQEETHVHQRWLTGTCLPFLRLWLLRTPYEYVCSLSHLCPTVNFKPLAAPFFINVHVAQWLA